MSQYRAQPDDITEQQTSGYDNSREQRGDSRFNNRHRMIHKQGHHRQIVGNQEIVNQIDVKCAPAHILQCAAKDRILGENLLFLAEERKHDGYTRQREQRQHDNIINWQCLAEHVSQEINQKANSNQVFAIKQLLNFGKMLLDQRTCHKEDKVIPVSNTDK